MNLLIIEVTNAPKFQNMNMMMTNLKKMKVAKILNNKSKKT